MSRCRGMIKATIVSICILFPCTAAIAYEPHVTMTLAMEGLIHNSEFQFSGSAVNTESFKDNDAAMLEFPLVIDGSNCVDGTYYARFQYDIVEGWAAGDVTRTTSVRFIFNPGSQEVVLQVTAFPSIQGHRTKNIFSYRYPLLDKLPFGDLCKDTQVNAFLARLYFDKYNSYVSVARRGAPFARVYSSPVSISLGTSMYEALVTGSKDITISGFVGDHTQVEARPVRLYTLKWKDFLNDLNVNFGANAYPVEAPFLDAGRVAPALVPAVIN